LVQKFSTTKVYKAPAVPTLLYVSEFWALKKRIKNDRHQSRLNFSEEQTRAPFVTTKRNEYVLEELKVEPADEKLSRHISNCLRHATE